MSLISVVMPVYNGERFVRDALESVLAQSFTDQEVLVFDDGSTDSSAEIISSIAKRDRRVVVHLRDHQGYTRLLNEGITLARGEFLARMDADDVCESERFARQLLLLAEHPEVVAVGTGMTIIDEAGDPFSVTCPPVNHADIDAAHLSGRGGALAHPTLMVRADAIRGIGGYRPEFEPAEDLDLLLRLAEVGKLANLPEPLLRYRVHSQMTSVVKRERRQKVLPSIIGDARNRRGLSQYDIERTYADGTALSCSPSRRCGQAFHSGFYRTAAKYALRCCWDAPLVPSNWCRWVRMKYLSVRIGDRVAGT
ncbi:MAG: glycosyltransferase [Planctomycetaceae bacterium]|nr:glycosyltransferase [Planctomycetaceae bacterium]